MANQIAAFIEGRTGRTLWGDYFARGERKAAAGDFTHDEQSAIKNHFPEMH